MSCEKIPKQHPVIFDCKDIRESFYKFLLNCKVDEWRLRHIEHVENSGLKIDAFELNGPNYIFDYFTKQIKYVKKQDWIHQVLITFIPINKREETAYKYVMNYEKTN